MSKFPVLFAALLEDPNVEWTEEDLGKLASNNLIRVFKQVEYVRDELKLIEPFQDWIPSNDVYPEENQCRSEQS